ncbi:hypothetical protein F5146DRAFT_996431 [Armillaria mellea]|nr:hypothetical protein F5146DRAFT_996431 [Armillaria mellea]
MTGMVDREARRSATRAGDGSSYAWKNACPGFLDRFLPECSGHPDETMPSCNTAFDTTPKPERNKDFRETSTYGKIVFWQGEALDFASDTGNDFLFEHITDPEQKEETIENFGRMSLDAVQILNTRLRDFEFSVFMTPHTARLLQWDRSGVIVSRTFNCHGNPRQLCLFLWRFGNATDAQQGIEENLAEDSEAVTDRLGRHYEAGKVFFMEVFDEGPDAMTKELSEPGKTMESEQDAPDSVFHTTDTRPSGNQNRVRRSATQSDERTPTSCFKTGHFTADHYRLVTGEVGYALEESITGEKESIKGCQSVFDILCTVEWKAGIIHYDISSSNIILVASGQSTSFGAREALLASVAFNCIVSLPFKSGNAWKMSYTHNTQAPYDTWNVVFADSAFETNGFDMVASSSTDVWIDPNVCRQDDRIYRKGISDVLERGTCPWTIGGAAGNGVTYDPLPDEQTSLPVEGSSRHTLSPSSESDSVMTADTQDESRRFEGKGTRDMDVEARALVRTNEDGSMR